ncbi:MAG: type II toxin-antitoxin system RelE/ParE family toxin [Sphingomonas phyllosphaerae]|uniref:type II toxin-antitoxin system RelE/ParE family toxin n=1 Tax=Sphingomonas phyllosphaerae TaxID=257003 RepID=UPI002FF6A683
MAVELSAEADRDLAELIASGLERYGLAASDRFVARLREAFEMIDSFPRIARLRDEIDGATRGFPVGVHIIFYQVDDADDVLILRIRHGREDWSAD